jgi:hypothetical protein
MKLTNLPFRSRLIALVGMVAILTFVIKSARELRVIDVTDFGAKAGGSDTTPSVRAALEEIRKGKATKLVFPPGRYEFHPDRATEEYLFISNNDEGLKRIAERDIWGTRSGDHKLIKQDGKISLYDLSTDISEARDLSDKLPDVRDRLRKNFDEWQASLPDPLWRVYKTPELEAAEEQRRMLNKTQK